MHKSAHQLYWLPSDFISIKQLVQEGFNWIDCAAGWGVPNAEWDGRECSSFQEYCLLLPVSADQWLPKASPEYFPTPMFQDGWGHPAPASFFTQIRQLTLDTHELVNWYRKVFLEFDVSISAELEQALFEPHRLVRLGYHLAKKVAQTQGVTSIAFQASMSAVGIGCRGIDLWVCDHCFRRSRGELRRCDLHSQAKLVLDLAGTDRNTQYQRARAAQKVLKALGSKAISERKFNGYWELELYEFEQRVGGILWSLTEAPHDEWLTSVMQALSLAPLISKEISKSFITAPYHEQIEQLQKAVGSREWLATRWPKIIPMAETWLQAETKIAPGPNPRGLNEHNQKRLTIAQELLVKNVSHSDIAVQLGISRPHLSKILRSCVEKIQE